MKLNDDVHNYYEHLVLEKLEKMKLPFESSPDQMADLCCLILNQLPPRYIRHEVDMAFYLSQAEYGEMVKNVDEAVKKSVQQVKDGDYH